MREARRRGKLLLPLVSDMQQKQMVGRGGRKREEVGRMEGGHVGRRKGGRKERDGSLRGGSWRRGRRTEPLVGVTPSFLHLTHSKKRCKKEKGREST